MPNDGTKQGEEAPLQGKQSLSSEQISAILFRHDDERRDLVKKHERIKSSIPRKDRIGRQRAAEQAQEETEQLNQSHQEQLSEHGISPSDLPSRAEAPPSADANPGVARSESKAARRRRKKALLEAESQRRIEEELANMGPSPKALELAAIAAQLRPMDLRIHSIPADGHCLYSALAHQMELHNLQSSVPPTVDALRNATADHLTENADEFMPFIEGVDGDLEAFQHYCDTMRSTAVWGGQVELKVLSHVLKAPIEVYAADMPVVRMGGADEDVVPKLRVSFHRQYLGLGEHYNSIVPGG